MDEHPLPTVDVDHLKLDVTPEEPRNYLQTMFELIYLAFKTDSTRVATYQFGRKTESASAITWLEPSASI